MVKLRKSVPALIGFLLSLLPCAGIWIVHKRIADTALKYTLAGILVLLALVGFAGYFYFRRRFLSLSDSVCERFDQILKGDQEIPCRNQETLTSKMIMEMEKINDILAARVRRSDSERDEIQKIVSDIAHQLKTPLANIRIYGDMLVHEGSGAEEEMFAGILQQQVGKLEFLIDSLVKMSRFESELIRLNQTDSSIFQTLGMAISTVVGKAEKKKIVLKVDCRETIRTVHDAKWTAEALENLLDNAIKYTDEGGKVSVQVRTGEMYVEIRIKDTGRGIFPEHHNDIFKRFYREKGVEKTEGLGIGLYLARQIISMQNGYIMVQSRKGAGSVFSVFLPI